MNPLRDSKGKRKWIVWAILSLFSLSFTYLWGVVIGFLRDYQSLPPHHLIGNRPSAAAALKENGIPFSFLVIGDASVRETTETLMDKALKKDKPSFMVLTGDFVKKPDIWSHRFFLTEMASERKFAFPVFLVAGNHDIDHKNSIRPINRSVTPGIYESLYGPRNFHFVFNQCLFIICGPDLQNPDEYLDYLRKTLSEKGKDKRYRFVFIHYPPRGLAEHIEGSLPIPREEEFFALLEKHRITTCFFGDYHGYWRGQRKGINLIVSGGGGRLKPSQPEWGKFHHILKVTVGEGKISEDIITIQGKWGVEDRFEEWVFTNIFPVLGTSVKVYYLILGFFLSIAGYSLFALAKVIRSES